MPRIRVMVVDDSVVVRKIICEALAGNPHLEVVATAASGTIALAKIQQVNPEVVTMDVEMPGMDGVATLKEIRRRYPTLPVIMFSTLTERGAAVTIEALSAGAFDYVCKPSNTASLASSMALVREDLTQKIRSATRREAPPTLSFPTLAPKPAARRSIIDVLAIGTSTGGPNALAEVIPALPRDLRVPVVVVQHMPPLFTRLLAERLSAKSSLPVRQGEAGVQLEPGHVWIAPGDYHMTVVRKGKDVFLDLNQAPPENFCRPAVDVLFRSVAAAYGPRVLAVVMTGMGSDGARGAAVIREAGGEIFAQDEPTSVVWGMPGAVVNAGLADQVFPLSVLSREVLRRIARGRVPASAPAAAKPEYGSNATCN